MAQHPLPWYEVTTWKDDGTSRKECFRARSAKHAISIARNEHRQAAAIEVKNMVGTTVATWGDGRRRVA